MKKVQFDMDPTSGDKIRVMAENFGSAAELVTYCQGKKCVKGMERDDFFNGRDPSSPSWSDFESAAALVDLVEHGVMDQTLLTEVGKYAKTAMVKDEEKLTQRCMDVVGGGVDVPAYLTGVPTCMHSVKRKKVKSKIIKLCIYCKALCDVDKDDYKQAGELITKTVAKLEKAGYRIRLIAMDAYEDGDYWKRSSTFLDGRHGIWVVTHVVKKENEPMNYRRIMFPLTRMAYHRGLGFGWMAVNGSPNICGLGGSIDRVVRDDVEREKLYAKACGADDYIILSQDDVIGYINKYGLDKAQKMVDAKVVSVA